MDRSFFRFVIIHAFDRQTDRRIDRQTDSFLIARPRLHSMQRCNKSFYRAFNAIYGKVGRLSSSDDVIQLLKSKCIPILLYGLDACPASPRQLRYLNYVVVSCGI